MEIEYKGNVYKTPTAHRKIATELAKEYCEKNNLSFKEITSKCGTWDVVKRRVKVARYLLSMGFTLEAVGYALNKDHTTIGHYKKERFD